MLKITLEESREAQPHLEDRLMPANPVYTPGKNIYEICPGCRLPLLHRQDLCLEPG